MTGGGGLIVKVNVALPVPVPLVALIVTLKVPAVVGVPEINPVIVLTLKPAGNGVALKPVGLLVAVIWYENATPTCPVAVSGLVITGFAASAVPAATVTRTNSKRRFMD
jgi:hypothetical protein